MMLTERARYGFAFSLHALPDNGESKGFLSHGAEKHFIIPMRIIQLQAPFSLKLEFLASLKHVKIWIMKTAPKTPFRLKTSFASLGFQMPTLFRLQDAVSGSLHFN